MIDRSEFHFGHLKRGIPLTQLNQIIHSLMEPVMLLNMVTMNLIYISPAELDRKIVRKIN